MYQLVKDSMGIAPSFAITLGLKEGYGPDAKLHTTEEVVDLVERFLKRRALLGFPFLTGSVSTGTLVYAWFGSEGAGSGNEPSVVYSGNRNPLYNGNMRDEEVTKFLNELAAALGRALNQTRVYVAYRSRMWILQEEGTTTPKGETVEAISE